MSSDPGIKLFGRVIPLAAEAEDPPSELQPPAPDEVSHLYVCDLACMLRSERFIVSSAGSGERRGACLISDSICVGVPWFLCTTDFPCVICDRIE
jgi:hypothetical protein